MKKYFSVLVVLVLLMSSCINVLGYDDSYFVEAENGFLVEELEDASKAESMVETSNVMRSLQTVNIIRVPFKVTRQSDGNYFMWSDLSLITFNGQVGYCIDPLIKMNMNAMYRVKEFDSVFDEHKREQISRIMYYGYSFNNHQTENYYLATQKLIWETLGFHVKYYAKNSKFTGVCDVSMEENEIVRLLNDHDKTISFDGQSLEMCVGDVVTLQDENHVLNDYVLDYDGEALSIEKVDNTLRISAKQPMDTVDITLRKGDVKVDGALIRLYNAKSSQAFVTMEKGAIEPLVAKLSIKVHALGDFELTKVDSESQRGLEGVVFEVSNDSNFEENVQRFVTNAEGKFELKKLIVGTYYYREIQTIEPYIRDDHTYSFIISENECTSVVCENTKQKVQLKIHKEAASINDFEASSASLDGAEYYVLDDDQTTVIEHVKANGKEAIVNTLLDVNTKYYVQEVMAPKGMEINPELLEVYVPYQKEQGNLIEEVTCYDEVIKNNIEITKYVHVYESEIPKKELKENFIFEIYNHQNEIVDTIVTDSDGKATSKLLPYGEYIVQEKAIEGYQSVDPIAITIDTSTRPLHYEIINEPVDYQLEILKTNSNQQPIAKVKYALALDASMQDILMIKETDENGKLVFTHLLPNTYYVQEQYVDSQYVLDTHVYEIRIDKDTQHTFVNAFKEVQLQITKCDEESNPIAGVTFRVKNDNVEKTGITDSKGKLSFILPYGEYEIEEVNVPKGYIGLDETITITIDEDRLYTLEVVNPKVPVVDTASSATPPWILVVTSLIGIVVGIYMRIYS